MAFRRFSRRHWRPSYSKVSVRGVCPCSAEEAAVPGAAWISGALSAGTGVTAAGLAGCWENAVPAPPNVIRTAAVAPAERKDIRVFMRGSLVRLGGTLLAFPLLDISLRRLPQELADFRIGLLRRIGQRNADGPVRSAEATTGHEHNAGMLGQPEEDIDALVILPQELGELRPILQQRSIRPGTGYRSPMMPWASS